MKSFIIWVLFLTTLFGFINSSFVFPDGTVRVEDSRIIPVAIIQQLFEMVRNLIVNGDIENGIPIMDPLEFYYKETHLNSTILNIHANISHGSILGLGTFELAQTGFDKSELSIRLDITFPKLTLQADYYKMAGDVFYVVPLKGEGIIKIHLNNARFWGKVHLKQSENGKAILLQKFENAHFTVDSVLVNYIMIQEAIHFLNRTQYATQLMKINARILKRISRLKPYLRVLLSLLTLYGAKERAMLSSRAWCLRTVLQAMKIIILLALVAVTTAAVMPEMDIELDAIMADIESQLPKNAAPVQRNFLLNALVKQLFAMLRRIIKNGSKLFKIPPLEPFILKQFSIEVPAEIMNLVLDIENGVVSGISGFVVHKSSVNMRNMSFNLDISVPKMVITTDRYKLLGNIFNAIPLYGDGEAKFEVEGFRVSGLLYLKQSEDEKSILIDRIENVSFQIPSLKSELTGAIGGGDIDKIVSAIIDEVVMDYANQFNGVISKIASKTVIKFANPFLGKLNSWRYIKNFV